MEKKDIFNLSPNALATWFKDMGQQGFRVNQLLQALWKQTIVSFQDMTVFPQELRGQLDQTFYINKSAKPGHVNRDSDGTIKALFQLKDGHYIESVGIPKGDERLTFCISTQAGCAMGCIFCATAKMNLVRHLTCGEITGQIRNLSQLFNKKPTNLVYMGMGEPMQNLSEVRSSLELITSKQTWGLSPSRITVSTCGWLPGIKKITDNPLPAKLAISLNAPTNTKRDQLMPVNKRYPLEQLLAAVRNYVTQTGQTVTFEYILIKNINDTEEDARILIRLLKNINAKVNIIPYNPVSSSGYQAPTQAAIEKFLSIMNRSPVTTTCRQSRGQSINAACGQLAGQSRRRK